MLPPNLRQEALSRAYVEAVAAHAGATVRWASSDFGVDCEIVEITRRQREYSESGTKVDVQLKSVLHDGDIDADFRYELSVRAYRLLRTVTPTPRLLVLVVLPTRPATWSELTDAGLLLRRRAFWVSLAGRADVRNRRSVRITIPAGQPFDARQLLALFARQNGGPPG